MTLSRPILRRAGCAATLASLTAPSHQDSGAAPSAPAHQGAGSSRCWSSSDSSAPASTSWLIPDTEAEAIRALRGVFVSKNDLQAQLLRQGEQLPKNQDSSAEASRQKTHSSVTRTCHRRSVARRVQAPSLGGGAASCRAAGPLKAAAAT